KLITKPPRPDLPIYLASLGPRNVALTAEIADGWLPVLVSPESFAGVFGGALDEGFSRTDDPAGSRAAFDIAPSVHAIVTDDVEEARDKIRPHVALYVGGMGARGKNFYNDLAGRYGYEEAAAEVQDLYLSGNQRAALAAVPDGLIDDLALVGSRDMVRDRLEAWREMGTTTLLVTVRDIETLRVLAELVG
ncbi:MAG: LLM class flavin-dependent oxidoreductase, partial [Acidimicrobiia bacterium]|nr:LLM class flavin-dependent oxidoreductase [Acidimicrobiia bacterium]